MVTATLNTMDRSSNFFNYGSHDEDDGSYQMFDGSGDGSRHGFQQSFTSVLPFSEVAPSPSLGQRFKPIQPAPGIEPSVPARASVPLEAGHFGYPRGVPRQSQLLDVPSFERLQLESPVLSSGSSATPDTRSSGQNVTPEDMVAGASRPQQQQQRQQQQQEHRHHRPGFNAIFPPPPPPPPATLAPRKRRPRKPRVKPELSVEEEEEKRDKFLARNRVAATKCRQKKREWMTDLEETQFGLESRHSHLQMEVNDLADEVSHIRAQLMTHANCNDPNINKWIENEAKRFVIGAGERYDAMLANFGQVDTHPQQQPRHESMSSVSGYTTSATNDPTIPTTDAESMYFPQGLGIHSSPELFRGRSPNDAIGGPMAMAESSYGPQTTRGGDPSDFNNSHMSNSMM